MPRLRWIVLISSLTLGALVVAGTSFSSQGHTGHTSRDIAIETPVSRRGLEGSTRAHLRRPRSYRPFSAAPVLRLPPPSSPFWRSVATVEHRPPWPLYQLALAQARHLRPFVLVFVFHQVCPADWPLRNGPDYITPVRLAEDLAFFKAHHITELTSAQFVGFLAGKTRVRSGSVFLTFDNGLEGVYRYAFPIVKAYHAHITLFLIGGRVYARWTRGDRYLAWNQVQTMVHSGYVDAQSETYNLHHTESIGKGVFGAAVLRNWETYPHGYWEPPHAWDHRVWQGFTLERSAFEQHLGYSPSLLVWPFSTYTSMAELEAREVGYRAAFAVYPGVVTRRDNLDLYALPRNPATYMWDNVPYEYELVTHVYDQAPVLASGAQAANRIPVVTLGTTPSPES